MAAAQIRLDHPAASTPTGIPGKARDDIVRGAAVTLRNQDNSGVTRWSWTLLDRPSTSSAAIVNPTSAVATVTPDKHGPYRLRLVVNAGGPGEIFELCFYALDPAGVSLPAAGERAPQNNYALSPGVYNDKGFARMMNDRALRSLDSRDSPVQVTGVTGGGGSTVHEIDWGLASAIVQAIEITSSTSIDSTFALYADAAATIQLHRWANVDATLGWRMFEPRFVAGLLGDPLEDNKIYLKITNDDAGDSDYSVCYRIKAP